MERRQQEAPPVTNIPPFTNPAILPACATSCGPLHDANGACVPPFAPVANGDTYNSCFCSHGGVSPFSTAVTGVCDAECQPDGLSSIANWFRDLCDVADNGNNGGVTTTTTRNGAQSTTTNGSDSDSDGSSGGSDDGGGGGGDWLSNHWQWVIMLVVLVVGIAAIWIGACIWRRRYLKKKDRQSTIGQKHSGSASRPSWGPGFPDPASSNNRGSLAPTPQYEDARTKGSFMPGATAAALEGEKSKRKWIPKSRT